jgi:methylated-DNA-[protein]-cysteine S-methyltransferase
VQVLRVLRQEVGFGRVVSYGELAGLAGNERAARAVGGALARNLWPLLVPCHRVVGAGGALTGFTNPCGLEMKRYLLELESTGSDRA